VAFALHGIPVSGGIAIGVAHVLDAQWAHVPQHLVDEEEIEPECGRLSAAIKTVTQELNTLFCSLPPDAPTEIAAFLDVHALILQDPMLSRAPLELIRTRRYNAHWALVAQMENLVAQFESMEDAYLRERQHDIRQVVERVLRVLQGRQAPALPEVGGAPTIVVAHDIAPADMLQFKDTAFVGFATDLGGATSHTAIVARSLGIPAVVGLQNAHELVRSGDMLIIDGDAGVVIVEPDERVLEAYRGRRTELLALRERLKGLRYTPARTRDGTRVSLLANIEVPGDAEAVLEAGAEGIGLFRSEFLFMNRTDMPDEDEQFEAYAQVVKALAGRPVTIRSLDVGSDKELKETDPEAVIAPNPALGLRAIRYCLAHPEMFLVQLRAILRASALGPVKLLIPMIISPREVDSTLAMLAQARSQLDARGIRYAAHVPVGGMIEIPGAALHLQPFLDRLDFLSIGTNDLIQYTLAIDRTDASVAHLYDPQHPAVLHLVEHTIRAGKRAGKSVSVCGEMAGDVACTHTLLAMGLTEFSMHPAQIPSVKRLILDTSLSDLAVRNVG
jgi:phosphotransferase system enzyme I (PtsI)